MFVQAECAPEQSVAEVDWVASLAPQVALRGIVARAPLEDPAATDEHLAAFAARPLVVGVRRLLQSEPDGFSAAPGFRDGARAVASAGLSFDACVRWTQLPDVIALADAVPELTIVLDHLGKPAGGVGGCRGVRPTARRGRPSCAGSRGATTSCASCRDCPRSPRASGPPRSCGRSSTSRSTPSARDRLLFGGDWPVSGPYGRWVETVSSWLDDRVGEHDRDAVLAANAERVYRLG